MMGSSKGNWGRYGLQAFGISVLGPSFWMYHRFWLLCYLQNGNDHRLAVHPNWS